MLLDADAFPSSLLAVMAHPDDVDFGAAGTVARLTTAGSTVTYAIVTSGEAGEVPGVPRAEVAALRQSEQRAAAAAVGVTDVRFLGFPDGMVEAGLELRRAITRVIRAVRPQVVLTMNPDRDYVRIGRGHPDHRATGAAAMDAVFPDSRNPYVFTELLDDEHLEPHVVEQLWFSGPNPDTWIDITETFEHKVAALRAHRSQTGHYDDLPGMLRTWLTANADAAGLAPGRLAEAFRVVHTG